MPSEYTELVERARRVLSNAGLVVEDEIDITGELAMCGTAKKPNGTDGRYAVHLDFPPNVYVVNYHDGGEGRTVPLYDKGALNAMTEAEREAMRERIRQEKEAAQARREEERRAAAEKANSLFPTFPLAGEDNAYLRRKGVLPRGDMRQDKGGRLVLPVRNAEGRLASLQFVDGTKTKDNKRFLKGGEKKGCYFPIPAKNGRQDGPLLIGEGVATLLSACMATGYAGLVAFDAGNLEAVAKMAREKYPDREIVLLADNDIHEDGSRNTGVEEATAVAQAVGGKLAVCPAIRGRKADFNDLFTDDPENGPERVRVVIEKAREGKALEGKAWASLPAGYWYDKKTGALMYDKKDSKGEIVGSFKICAHVEVIGRTYGAGKWGVLMEWKDRRGDLRRLSIPSRLFQQQGTAWAEMLADEGLDIEAGQQTAFKRFILGLKDDCPIIRNVDRVGWFDTCFVLPDETIGTGKEEVVLQVMGEGIRDLYQTGGTLEGWQDMARLCAGNSRFEFALALGFAAPLLAFANMDGSIFNLEGGSSTGKTTALKIAASTWGSPSHHVRAWRVTDNGLESVCPLHNDNLLILDELGQVGGRALSEVAYMFANGTGKTRAARNGGIRAAASWRGVLLSSGELGLTAKLNEDGIQARAGQEVRFIGVSMSREHLKELYGREPGQLMHELSSLPFKHYGHAGREFLRRLTPRLDELAAGLGEALDALESEWCPAEADTQVHRVARRFALVCAGGGMAQSLEVLPKELNIIEAVKSCFDDWLTERGSTGAAEDAAILSDVRRFIEQYGASRFQDVDRPDAVCVNRVGFRRKVGDSSEYFILPEMFKAEVVRGYAQKRAAEVLRRAGWLRTEDGKNSIREYLPGMGRTRCYAVTVPEEQERRNNQKK